MRGHFLSALSRTAFLLTMCGGLAACATTSSRLTVAEATTSDRLTVAEATRPNLPAAPARSMPLGAQVEPPVGFVSLCMRSPIDCVHDDTPQARADAVLQAQTIARARWQRILDRAANRGEIEAVPVAPASTGAPSATAQALPAAAEQPQPAALAPVLTPAVFTPAAAPAPAAAAPSASRIELDAQTLTRLRVINAYVNRAIRPGEDLQLYGVSDWWVAPLSSHLAPYGDCKDYVLEKRRELIGAGLPPRALSIALVRTAWGESHAVLVVATSEGDLVLDNLSGEIKAWDRTPYAWESRQSAEDPLVWHAVADKFAVQAPARRTQVAFAEPRRAFAP